MPYGCIFFDGILLGVGGLISGEDNGVVLV